MKRCDNFIMRNVGGENILVPLGTRVLETNGLVILNDTARCIWELLAEDRSLDELATAVRERFNVDHERSRADVQTFMDQIAKMGMLRE